MTVTLKTSPFEQLDKQFWDVVILGAGVAGAAAAILSANLGMKTLLLEAKSFPREKVCGGCLNLRAQASLDRLSVLGLLPIQGAISIHQLHLQIGTTAVDWKIPTMTSIRRSTLDMTLVQRAIQSGAAFFDEVHGFVVPRQGKASSTFEHREIEIQHGQQRTILLSKIVVVADGLTRSSLRNETHWHNKIEPRSRIGVQRMLSSNEVKGGLPNDVLGMFVGANGYVGLSHTDGGFIDVAGAIDPKSIQKEGGIQSTVNRILEECNGPILPGAHPNGDNVEWLATPALTRSSTQVACDRIFLIGDAIGYVEPFTGEGMSWALASAEAVIPLVNNSVKSGWSNSQAEQWTTWNERQRRYKQSTCLWISRQLRRPRMAAWTLRFCDSLSPVRAALIKRVTS